MIANINIKRADTPIPAIFLDRDGTINIEKNYLYRAEDWQWIEGAQEAIKQLKNAGYMIVVISNQAGIARKMYNESDVTKLHDFVNAELAKTDTAIDAFYFCPHHPDFSKVGTCQCRKPAPNMILQAAQDLNIDLEKSWMIGDKLIDIQAGTAAGVKAILVRTGYGKEEENLLPHYAKISDNLSKAAQFILDSRNS